MIFRTSHARPATTTTGASTPTPSTRTLHGLCRGPGIPSTLDPKDVRAYLFAPDGDGTDVRPLGVSPEDGISEEAFADVVQELYEESISIERTAQR
jgi:hypothetical protein